MQQLFKNSKRHLLLVEDNEAERAALLELLEGTDLEITAVGTGAQAMESLTNRVVDCMVLDLTLPDISGLELLRRLQEDPNVPSFPIIVHAGRELSLPEANQLKSFSKSIIVKDVHSPERLLEKSALFLHRRLADMSPDKRGMIERLAAEPTLENKKILIVDDDFRNIFSLTAVLERYNATVLAAENGRHALEMLDQDRGIDLVLMDIMMPEMDGYETTKRIRELTHFSNLPIIALTAKAMKGDREKCLDAGASDYIAKPVNIEQLMSLLRLWLYR
jgi:CheY-like chemotaxis protein